MSSIKTVDLGYFVSEFSPFDHFLFVCYFVYSLHSCTLHISVNVQDIFMQFNRNMF